MSLIVGFSFNSTPLIIGDLLISGDEAHLPGVNLPTIVDIKDVFPPGSGFVPIGLKQKVIVVNEKLCVAWAGKMIEADYLIDEITEEFKAKEVNLNNVQQFMDKINKEIQLSTILTVIENVYIYQMSYRCTEIDHAFLGRLRIGGTGADLFLKTIEGVNYTQLQDNKGIDNFKKELSTAIALCGASLSQGEIFSFDNLLEYFGGGFEIVTSINASFQKVGDITYLY